MKADLGIPESKLKAVALKLNQLLANEYVLYTKTRNSHWNIVGNSFIELHLLFEKQYQELDAMIDEIAERIRSIGHFSEGRLVDFLKLTDLVEQEYSSDQKVLLTNLLDDHQTLIRQIRKLIDELADKYNDIGSSDFVTGLMKQHEKMAWMLRAHLK